ncbi:hypothetical protein D3C73_1347030 [compost metagenome]
MFCGTGLAKRPETVCGTDVITRTMDRMDEMRYTHAAGRFFCHFRFATTINQMDKRRETTRKMSLTVGGMEKIPAPKDVRPKAINRV